MQIVLPDAVSGPAAPLTVEMTGELAQLTGEVKGFPDGWETMVGERGITISGSATS